MKKIKVLVCILLLISACGKTEVDIKTPPSPPKPIPVPAPHRPLIDAMYFLDSFHRRIDQYRLNPGDPSRPFAMIPDHVNTGENPTSLTIHPSHKWAYILNSKDHTIFSYTIDPIGGHLGHFQTTPCDFKDVATHLTMDLDGKILYAVHDLAAPAFYPYSINENGIPNYIGP